MGPSSLSTQNIFIELGSGLACVHPDTLKVQELDFEVEICFGLHTNVAQWFWDKFFLLLVHSFLKVCNRFHCRFPRASIESQLQRCGTKGRDSPDEERKREEYHPVRRII